MEVWQKEALLRHRMAILDDLHVDYVLDYLLARQVLFEEHKESIFTQHGRRDRARRLLDLLPSLGPSAYGAFIASLKEPYYWLAETLCQESAKTVTNVASTSQYSVSNTVRNQQHVPLNPGDIHQLLTSLGSVATTCGKSLCAIGDAVSVIVQSMNYTGSAPSPNTRVSRQNSINLSKNEQLIVGAGKQVEIDRLRGGVDAIEDKIVMRKTEKIEVPPSSLPLPENSFNIKETLPSKNTDGDPEKIEGIATVEKIIDSAYVYGDTVDGLFTNEEIIEENISDSIHDLMINEMDDVTCTGENVEPFKTSHAKDELYNDSPDSGITGDQDLEEMQRGVASLVIVQENGIPSLDEDFEEVKMDLKSDEADGLLMTPSESSQWMTDKDSNRELNHPLSNALETLRQSLAEMTVVLRAVVQITEKTIIISSSIPN